MKPSIQIIPIVSLLLLSACNTAKKETTLVTATPETTLEIQETDMAKTVLNDATEAHGGDLYNTASYSLTFRERAYTFTNDNGRYVYTMKGKQGKKEIYDVLDNGKLTREINGTPVKLSARDISKYTASVNSVIYFATLPHKLHDAAVNKTYEGTTTIKGEDYDILGITFNQENGGKDYDDEFHYWINKKTKRIDYLAYNYLVDGGGVRFRSAYNPRMVDGILFQDYVNYKAPLKTPLAALPALYEKGALKELSRIVTEDVQSLKNAK